VEEPPTGIEIEKLMAGAETEEKLKECKSRRKRNRRKQATMLGEYIVTK
jgi:hypothetical protein